MGRANVGGGGRVMFCGGRAPGGGGMPPADQGNPLCGLGPPCPGGLSGPPWLGIRAGGMPGRMAGGGGPMSKLLLLSVGRSGGGMGLPVILGGSGGRGPTPTMGREPAKGGRCCGGPAAGRICDGKT